MKRKYVFWAVLLVLAAFAGYSALKDNLAAGSNQSEASFQYITASDLKAKMDAYQPVIMLDARPLEAFVQKHIIGSAGTGAYPVDTEDKEQQFMNVAEMFEDQTAPIVLIDNQDQVAAKNAFNLLKGRGYQASRLYILEGGIDGWPYSELIEENK